MYSSCRRAGWGIRFRDYATNGGRWQPRNFAGRLGEQYEKTPGDGEGDARRPGGGHPFLEEYGREDEDEEVAGLV